MAATDEFLTFIGDQFRPFGEVQIRGMFGGHGIFRDGVMFALIADETTYLKAGAENDPDFDAENMPHFTYEGKNKPVQMSYWRLPDHVLEDAETLSDWAQKAFTVALAAKRPKRKK